MTLDPILSNNPTERVLRTDVENAAVEIAKTRSQNEGNRLYSYMQYSLDLLERTLLQKSFDSLSEAEERIVVGLIGEAMFLVTCKQLGIPIEISTWEEDEKGCDFFVGRNHVPVDVTFSSEDGEKYTPGKYITLKLPKNIIDQKERRKYGTYLRQVIATGHFDPRDFFRKMVKLNNKTGRRLNGYLDNPGNNGHGDVGPANVANLKKLLDELYPYIR